MARAQTPPILAGIQSARTYAEQTTALRSVKNEVVGHIQKQHRWVAHGILEPIVEILLSARSPSKLNGKNTRGHAVAPRPLLEEEQVRLQAIQLLASFANGGAAFLTPLHGAGALRALLENLCPVDNHPRVVLATLKALRSFADAASFVLPTNQVQSTLLADEIFAEQHLESLSSILASPGPPTSIASTSLVNAAAGLIAALCREERHQILIANAGILDALATRLASFVVARGEVVPGAHVVAENEGIAEAMPAPAPAGLSLAVTLDAICAVVADSRLRACMLLYSPSILAVFPNLDFTPPAKDTRAAWDALEAVGLGSSRPPQLGAIDFLLPAVPGQPKGGPPQISPFPPLGSTRDYSSSRLGTSRSGTNLSSWDSSRLAPTSAGGETGGSEDPEVPLIPWLMRLAADRRGAESLSGADVLTSLYKAGFAGRYREAALGSLAVPLLTHLLNDSDRPAGCPPAAVSAWVDDATATRWERTERVLTVLARLIADSEVLQKSAFQCGAVETVCKLLKEAYEPIKSHDGGFKLWSPSPAKEADILEALPSAQHGQLPLNRHRVRLRECALKALASLVSFKNEYRKQVCDQDAVPYIVESLAEFPAKPGGSTGQRSAAAKALLKGSDSSGEPPAGSGFGRNTAGVLIAACHTIKLLARSVSIVRTTLQDAGVTEPLVELLKHHDIEVQIAATGAICNLVVDFSPMRERYTELGIMRILCRHAHSMNADLRLNALWALKHYVHGLRLEMKRACLDELQSGWLVQLICDDTEDDALFSKSRQEQHPGTSTSWTGDDMDEDVEMDHVDEDEDEEEGGSGKHWTGTSTPSSSLLRGPGAASPRVSHERSRTGRLRRAEVKLAALRDAELNPQRKARSDDLAIQEQGLNFIRNLITTSNSGSNGAGGAGSDYPQDTAEMIDYLFSALGQDRLFEILASKLRHKVLHPFNRRLSPSSLTLEQGQQTQHQQAPSRVLYPQAKVIEAVICILVHIAASVPRHRQLVIAQTDLLRLLGRQFASRDKEVRVSLCHLISNLTWRDDGADTQASERRAEELRRLGLMGRLESLQQDDADLDVRERAKGAVWQMKQGGAAGAIGH
ncbi:armadillo repeat protein [Gaeumannomyces tritici R3-111a-1]|uniref:Armadillo repeat protein n=1 Tax=Gaeumannomyces tritici (strain R3-111a-1) TaxID=644352 RepID=J3PHN7_GAET3|nr:armadillo repeat protein [Gaeumannomyces tritici R3-111a-1]EJT69398.1 armadillo repeat protein [Gaeumannomyces tritici R3-111a-1]